GEQVGGRLLHLEPLPEFGRLKPGHARRDLRAIGEVGDGVPSKLSPAHALEVGSPQGLEPTKNSQVLDGCIPLELYSVLLRSRPRGLVNHFSKIGGTACSHEVPARSICRTNTEKISGISRRDYGPGVCIIIIDIDSRIACSQPSPIP